jgi:hypothetical protein
MECEEKRIYLEYSSSRSRAKYGGSDGRIACSGGVFQDWTSYGGTSRRNVVVIGRP